MGGWLLANAPQCPIKPVGGIAPLAPSIEPLLDPEVRCNSCFIVDKVRLLGGSDVSWRLMRGAATRGGRIRTDGFPGLPAFEKVPLSGRSLPFRRPAAELAPRILRDHLYITDAILEERLLRVFAFKGGRCGAITTDYRYWP